MHAEHECTVVKHEVAQLGLRTKCDREGHRGWGDPGFARVDAQLVADASQALLHSL